MQKAKEDTKCMVVSIATDGAIGSATYDAALTEDRSEDGDDESSSSGRSRPHDMLIREEIDVRKAQVRFDSVQARLDKRYAKDEQPTGNITPIGTGTMTQWDITPHPAPSPLGTTSSWIWESLESTTVATGRVDGPITNDGGLPSTEPGPMPP